MKTTLTLIAIVAFLSACGGKKQVIVENPKDTIPTETPIEVPDENNMDHFTSGYQNWIVENDMKEAFGYAQVWFDGKFVIVSDSSRRPEPRFTLKIEKCTEVDSTTVDKDLGGLLVHKVYQLESNDVGFDKLIVSNNEYERKIYKSYKYTTAFTFSGKRSKSYYCTKDE